MNTDLPTLKQQLYVLRDVAASYSGRTIDNIIQNYEARIEHLEKIVYDSPLIEQRDAAFTTDFLRPLKTKQEVCFKQAVREILSQKTKEEIINTLTEAASSSFGNALLLAKFKRP